MIEGKTSMTPLQKATAQAIVNVFETGQVGGDYGNVTLLAGDTGHLTYGRSQTTLASGNLFLLIKAYCEAEAGAFAQALSLYLLRLKICDFDLDHDLTFRQLLRAAGRDPVMVSVQDTFFDAVYWAPAASAAAALEIDTPLGVAVVYDSTVHGSWKRMHDRTNARFGAVSARGEKEWIAAYVAVRGDWLATHPNKLLHKTVYRMETFRALIKAGNWALELPLVAHGTKITRAALQLASPVVVSARDDEEEEPTRLLLLDTPHLTGDDVRACQEVLLRAGISLEADGDFGPATEKAVIAFQKSKGLKADGIVGPATRSALGL